MSHHHEISNKNEHKTLIVIVFTLIALLAGKYFNFIYLDPLIGILGGVLILRWAAGLLKDTVKILIDFKASNSQ